MTYRLFATTPSLVVRWLAGFAGAMILCSVSVLSAPPGSRAAHTAARIEIKTLSSRPGLVSGGDALVQITGPAEILARGLTVWLEDRDVTGAFRVSPLTHTLIGRVDRLAPEQNTLVVKTGRRVRARLVITNHSITGPIFSGRHQTPFICETWSMGLGPALDEDCSAKTVVTYLYKSTQTAADRAAKRMAGDPPRGFKRYSLTGPSPGDVAETTTSQGKRVKYIVRREIGTINRAIYEVAFLHEPGTPLPDPWTRTPGWNGRLVYSFGGGCNGGHRQGHPPEAVDGLFLSRGYAHATSSLDVFGNNCDDVISAETMDMVKEHFIKRFGMPVHTIGWGGSGGSMQQYLIGQNYPGLLDGIIPSASFPDLVTIVPGIIDCTLMAHAFHNVNAPWTEGQKTAASGFATWESCSKESPGNSWIKTRFSPELNQPMACNSIIPHALVYDPASNPNGARCDVYDNEVNVFGRDPKTGFVRRPLDNVGVQYGLVAFNEGKISADEFLELNQKMGGYNDDGRIVATRMVGDREALRIAYQTGQVNGGRGGLSAVPIIDVRAYVDTIPDIHDEFRSFVIRARLQAANGNADNQVMLTFPFSLHPGAKLRATFGEEMSTLVPAMDHWLDDIAKDQSSRSILEKIAAAKPQGVADACWSEDGERIVEKRTADGTGRCNQLFPAHGDPRIAAGQPLAEDILKCALKPVNAGDYVHPLTDKQWVRLKTIFRKGVCDYTRRGIGQQPMQGTWRTY